MTSRTDILDEARSWIGTPYRHQASVKATGCDCLGLIRGIWRACVGPEPVATPAYRPDWAELGGKDMLLDAAQTWLQMIDNADAEPGDILLFRIRINAPVKHCAILSGADRMIHAYQGHHVCETSIGPWWDRRIAAVARFPNQD